MNEAKNFKAVNGLMTLLIIAATIMYFFNAFWWSYIPVTIVLAGLCFHCKWSEDLAQDWIDLHINKYCESSEIKLIMSKLEFMKEQNLDGMIFGRPNEAESKVLTIETEFQIFGISEGEVIEFLPIPMSVGVNVGRALVGFYNEDKKQFEFENESKIYKASLQCFSDNTWRVYNEL